MTNPAADPVPGRTNPEHGGGDPISNAMWREILLGTVPHFRYGRRLFRHLPSSPRCKFCALPFAGPVGAALRATGRKPWPKNPKYCGSCFTQLQDHHGGAEVPCSVLFADVRGSTGLAERMTPSTFRDLLNRFYEVATEALVQRDAIVDKFVGDEVMAIFIPALAGADHAGRAVEAARDLLAATGHGTADGPWAPIGVGIAVGTAYVGSVGSGDTTDLTALGDIVNVGARLASAAHAGEILVTGADDASIEGLAEGERRTVEVRGRTEPVEVISIDVSSGSTARP